jgi:small subunit ribosomal protein S5
MSKENTSRNPQRENSRNNQRDNRNASKENARKEYSDYVVSVKRVTKVTKGGKRFQFSAFVVSGNGSGKIGIGSGKGKDVSVAVAKATVRARKSIFEISLRDKTIPFVTKGTHGASYVLLQPAYPGSGLIAGGAVRFVLRAAGIDDIIAKSIGPSRSGINLVKATLNALSKCRSINHIAKLRGKSVGEILKGSHNVA